MSQDQTSSLDKNVVAAARGKVIKTETAVRPSRPKLREKKQVRAPPEEEEQTLRRPPVGYTVDEVGQMLRVSRNMAYQMVAKGEVPSIRIGRLVRIPYAPFHQKFGDCIPPRPRA